MHAPNPTLPARGEGAEPLSLNGFLHQEKPSWRIAYW